MDTQKATQKCIAQYSGPGCYATIYSDAADHFIVQLKRFPEFQCETCSFATRQKAMLFARRITLGLALI
jgi:hypothetical protein